MVQRIVEHQRYMVFVDDRGMHLYYARVVHHAKHSSFVFNLSLALSLQKIAIKHMSINSSPEVRETQK